MLEIALSWLLMIGLPLAVGVSLAAWFCSIRRRHPTPLPWPIFVFVLLLGIACANLVGVYCGDADALISSASDGFPSYGQFDALAESAFLFLIAFPGLLLSGFMSLPVLDSRSPSAGGAWVWSWLLSQSLLDITVFVLGLMFPFQAPLSNDGFPLWLYLLIVGTLTVALGFSFGYRWGRRHGILAPLLGWLALSAVTILLLALMRGSSADGLALTQCPAGSWYALLFSPSAVLLGAYRYHWKITWWSLLASGLAPHFLFTLGYLMPKLWKRGDRQ